MGKQTEEELKEKILNSYSQFFEEASSDRRQLCYQRLCLLVCSWCDNYLYINEKGELGLEVTEAVKNCVEKGKMPDEEFIKYIRTALRNAHLQYLRNSIVIGSFKKARIIMKMKKFIIMEEKEKGRDLTVNEQVQCIRYWFNKGEKNAREYLESMERRFVNNTIEDDDNTIDITESMADHSLTMEGTVSDPQEEALADSEVEIIKDMLETVLKKA